MTMQGASEIFIIDANASRVKEMSTVLNFLGEAFVVLSMEQARQRLEASTNGDILLIGDAKGFEDLIKTFPGVPVIVQTEHAKWVDKSPNIVGALTESINYASLTQLLHRAQTYQRNKPTNQAKPQTKLFRSLVGKSKQMQDVRFLIEQVANTEANVLILGESGTGKEVVARNIHFLSPRSEGPFVPVNCGAIPGDLLESELFGHEKGAFTGAITARKGRFELAQDGTLFLDEIGDMPLPMQVKLLRVLQEKSYERVGGTKSIQANVRIVAATHRNLDKMIEEEKFREDLFYRLNVFPIDTPGLKERAEDIPLLLQELVSRQQAETGKSLKFTEQALESLMKHTWPGNVRELSNLVERMMILYPDQVIDVNELPFKYQHVEADRFEPEYPEEILERDALLAIFSDDEPAAASADNNSLPEEGVNLKEYLSELEVDLIRQALDHHDGVVARAADMLGMRRTTLVEKMRKYGLQRD